MLALLLVWSCKRTKDTFTSRFFHRTVSRFNPLFNGEQALLKGENSLKVLHEDDFSRILPVFKLGTKDQASNVKPDMDKAIEKATKVIREHSMLIHNNQKNKYIDDSYLLLGEARFYKREYLEALETFNYVVQSFPKSKIVPEAQFWAARTETQLGNYLSAQDRFEKLYRDTKLPKKLKGDVFAAYAQLQIDQKKYTPAYQLLDQAVDKTHDKEKEVRWLFIMGQLQAQVGNNVEASELFRKVIRKGPPYELLFQAQLSRARTYDVDLNDPEVVFDALRKMLKDEKNIDNRDQIYYVMAEVAEKLGDEGLMEEYLKKSIRASTTNNKQKALSYLKLAETNFVNRQYALASAYYDSTFSNLQNTNPRYEEIKKKKESLGKLVTNLNIIETQDSLQALAGLSEKERLAKIDKLIASKQEAEEAKKRQEENVFNNSNNVFNNQSSIAQTNQNSIEGGAWYFYNQNLRAAGVRDFNIKFGNRKLEDNWRRKDKQVIASFDNGNANGNAEEDKAQTQEDDEDKGPETADQERQQYLKEVPLSPKDIIASNEKIIQAYMAVGSIYKDDFEDYNASEKALKELLSRYPDLAEKGRVWYMLYRVNVLAKDTKDAEYYKNLILTNMPDSEYAALLQGKEAEGGDVKKAIVFYNKTYGTYKAAAFKKSLSMSDSGLTAFGTTEQGPRFMMVKAYSLGKLGQQSKMGEVLSALVAKYPQTDQSKEAQEILDRLNGATPDSTGAGAGQPKAAAQKNASVRYKNNPNEEHKYVLIVPNSQALVSNLNIDLTNFDQKYFKNLPLKVKAVFLSQGEQMILVNGLTNEKKAMEYMNVLQQQNVLDKYLKGQPIKHFVISNSNFQRFYQDRDFEGYQEFFNQNILNKE